MGEEEIENIKNYWENMATHDHKTMLASFKSKEYSSALFFGHIVLEKILKSLFVKENRRQAPYSHDLPYLNSELKSGLSAKEKNLLIKINDFNIRARYPDVKLEFYKKCTLDYTRKRIKEIDSIYQKICKKLKQ
ncbi:MAG: HEPN domain-containing protein [Candidatus Paceibacterota bacterium]|jgi:HEPN domain-containing protein